MNWPFLEPADQRAQIFHSQFKQCPKARWRGRQARWKGLGAKDASC
jgi:hypothetical protein